MISLNFNDIVITKSHIYFQASDALKNFNFASCQCDNVSYDNNFYEYHPLSGNS
jgi:hypothetical protein